MLFASESLSRKAVDVEQRERTIKAARGIIYDRNGVKLADNQPVCTISVIYHQIKEPDYQESKWMRTAFHGTCS